MECFLFSIDLCYNQDSLVKRDRESDWIHGLLYLKDKIMAKKFDYEKNRVVSYKLSKYSLKVGEVRQAKALKVQADNSLNLVVTINEGDFAKGGRVLEPYIDDNGKPQARIVGKIIDGYLYVNNVPQGDSLGEWQVT